MILTGKEIAEQVKANVIKIHPYDPAKLNPNSYNVTLGNTLVTYSDELLDCKIKPNTHLHKIPITGVVLIPNTIYLAHTFESIGTDKFVAMLEGRSSLGRLGLFIHATAGFGDIGFHGQWTLEISVIQPLKIYPGMEIGQIYFHTTQGEIELYKGKYQGQLGATASRAFKDF